MPQENEELSLKLFSPQAAHLSPLLLDKLRFLRVGCCGFFFHCLGSGKFKLCVNWSLQVLMWGAEGVPWSRDAALCWETCAWGGAAWTL